MTNKSATVKEQVEQFFLWYRGYKQRSLGLVLLYHSVFISFIVLFELFQAYVRVAKRSPKSVATRPQSMGVL